MTAIQQIINFFHKLFGGGVSNQSTDIRIWMPVYIKKLGKAAAHMREIARIMNRLAAAIEIASSIG